MIFSLAVIARQNNEHGHLPMPMRTPDNSLGAAFRGANQSRAFDVRKVRQSQSKYWKSALINSLREQAFSRMAFERCGRDGMHLAAVSCVNVAMYRLG